MKQDVANLAVQHTLQMEELHSDEIQYSVNNTTIFDFTNVPEEKITDNVPKQIYENIDSVSAVLKYPNCCVLNFASYTNPGGGYINGAVAQEECLCQESFLYNVLQSFENYYRYNRNHKNNSLYFNRALYSPKIIFSRDGKEVKADVITCASPNWNSASSSGVTEQENYEALKNRIILIKRIAESKNVNTLILGAFGCGVFGQNPQTVVDIYREVFAHSTIKQIIHPVPGNNNNTKVFEEAYK